MIFVKIAGTVFNADKVTAVQVVNKGGTPAKYGLLVSAENGSYGDYDPDASGRNSIKTLGNFDTFELAQTELDKLIK